MFQPITNSAETMKAQILPDPDKTASESKQNSLAAYLLIHMLGHRSDMNSFKASSNMGCYLGLNDMIGSGFIYQVLFTPHDINGSYSLNCSDSHVL